MGIPSETWLPIATLIFGAVSTALFDAARDRRAYRREREARRESRSDAIRLRRIDFQRATLLELQDAVSELVRFAARAHHEDIMAFRASGQWRKNYLSKEVDEGYRKESLRTLQLRVRVRDDGIRNIAGELSGICSRMMMSHTERDAEQNIQLMTALAEDMHERIGAAVRGLDDDEDQAAGITP